MKSIFGLSENVVAALSYVLGPLSGIFVLVAERENKFVRFHALQSTLWFLLLWIVFWVVGILTGLPLIGGILWLLTRPVMWIWTLLFVSSKLFLILQAALGRQFKLPFIGDVAWNQVHK